MKKIKTILNVAIALVGVDLLYKMMITYDNPITVGAIWIGLVCLKCLLEIVK